MVLDSVCRVPVYDTVLVGFKGSRLEMFCLINSCGSLEEPAATAFTIGVDSAIIGVRCYHC